MASILAVVDLTGAPVDRAALPYLAAAAPYVGDRARAWAEGPVGLCSVPLGGRSPTSSFDVQPGSTPGVVVALDGRLDRRRELVEMLLSAGLAEARDADDPGLVRLAYAVWGPALLEHLAGEFAFCLWDGRARRLLAARDHFGVKPLYLSQTPRALILGTTIGSLRRVPGVSSRLSDRAVGDLLVFGDPQYPSDTVFADIERVPPAHAVSWSPGLPPRVRPFWRLEMPAPMRPRDAREAPARLRETLQRAVADRVAGAVGVLMSGGLDSTSVAALARGAAGASVRAVTAVHETLFEDPERQFSRVAADALGIALEQHPVDGYDLFERWGSGGLPPLPLVEPLTAVMADVLDGVSRHADVALVGDGGDPLLLPATVPRQLGRLPAHEVARGVWRLGVRYWRLPLFGLRSSLARWRRTDPVAPSWLADSLLARYDPRARLDEVAAPAREGPRPEALQALRASSWPSLFESLHPGVTGRPVEIRYPFFDLRVVSLGLALPTYPWCIDKIVLRDAMAGLLPDAVRLRPKTPLVADPVAVRRRWTLAEAVGLLEAAPGMDGYVDPGRFAASVREDGLLLDAEPGTLAAVSLAIWLTHAAGARDPATCQAATPTA